MESNEKSTNVSIIIPIFNGEKWINKCFDSIMTQTGLDDNLKVELSIYNDASTDGTQVLLEQWKCKFLAKGFSYVVEKNTSGSPLGVGFAKNNAIKNSTGEYLCFQDIDDQMLPHRVCKQLEAAKSRKNMIIGSKFYRDPPQSTERYTNWANNLSEEQLNIQIYTSHGPTVIMPTWFIHKNVFECVGGFSEDGKGVPEDLIFFYEHINKGGKIHRVDDYLLIYTYHQEATTFYITSENIWNLRLKQLRKDFLSLHNTYTIWNCHKQGRKFFKSLKNEERLCVVAMCDVDISKIGKYYEMFDPDSRKILYKIPIIHYKIAKPLIIVCVKMDMTKGEFENNLNSLKLTEGVDYVLFS